VYKRSPEFFSSSEFFRGLFVCAGFAVYGLGISDYRLIQQLLSLVLSSSFNASGGAIL
jgi:hypothetical protein